MKKFFWIYLIIIYFITSNALAYEKYEVSYKRNLFEQYVTAYDNGEIICPKPDNPLVKNKLQKEFLDYLKDAKKGSAKAAYFVSLGYLNEIGVKLNNQQGIYWLQKAVEQDYVPAQLTYAAIIMYKKKNYANLISQPPSEQEMLNWINQAAENGNITAQLAQEMIYLEKDESQHALSLAESRAKNRYAQHRYVLGNIYYYGLATQVDYAKAIYWYQLALKHDPPLIVDGMIVGNMMDIYTKPGFQNTELAKYWENQLKKITKISACVT